MKRIVVLLLLVSFSFAASAQQTSREVIKSYLYSCFKKESLVEDTVKIRQDITNKQLEIAQNPGKKSLKNDLTNLLSRRKRNIIFLEKLFEEFGQEETIISEDYKIVAQFKGIDINEIGKSIYLTKNNGFTNYQNLLSPVDKKFPITSNTVVLQNYSRNHYITNFSSSQLFSFDLNSISEFEVKEYIKNRLSVHYEISDEKEQITNLIQGNFINQISEIIKHIIDKSIGNIFSQDHIIMFAQSLWHDVVKNTTGQLFIIDNINGLFVKQSDRKEFESQLNINNEMNLNLKVPFFTTSMESELGFSNKSIRGYSRAIYDLYVFEKDGRLDMNFLTLPTKNQIQDYVRTYVDFSSKWRNREIVRLSNSNNSQTINLIYGPVEDLTKKGYIDTMSTKIDITGSMENTKGLISVSIDRDNITIKESHYLTIPINIRYNNIVKSKPRINGEITITLHQRDSMFSAKYSNIAFEINSCPCIETITEPTSIDSTTLPAFFIWTYSSTYDGGESKSQLDAKPERIICEENNENIKTFFDYINSNNRLGNYITIEDKKVTFKMAKNDYIKYFKVFFENKNVIPIKLEYKISGRIKIVFLDIKAV